MNDENIFYVYEHWRPDTGVCFYVGKGRDRRAWDMKNDRNARHTSVVSKLISMGLAADVRVIVKDISSETACSLERDRIAFHGVETLTNMNRGGGGVIRHSPEAISKISATSKGRKARLGFKASNETKERNRLAGIAGINTFIKYSALGPKARARPVLCIDDGRVFESAKAAERFYNAASGTVTQVCLKKKYRHSVLGRKFKFVEAA
jgi:hypothetical protein